MRFSDLLWVVEPVAIRVHLLWIRRDVERVVSRFFGRERPHVGTTVAGNDGDVPPPDFVAIDESITVGVDVPGCRVAAPGEPRLQFLLVRRFVGHPLVHVHFLTVFEAVAVGVVVLRVEFDDRAGRQRHARHFPEVRDPVTVRVCTCCDGARSPGP